MTERLVHKADFERLLAVRARSRSAHFAVHHVSGSPSTPKRHATGAASDKLSTNQSPPFGDHVDNFAELKPVAPELRHEVESQVRQWWLGCVVPKRLAKRAVTRNLLKRQIRCVFARRAALLAPGLWLVRMHQGFPVAEFVSAKSRALNLAARTELEALFARTL